MSAPFVIPHNRMLRDASWLFDESLKRADDASDAAYERRQQVERRVSFYDVLEQMVEFSDVQRDEFMKALERGNAQDLHLIHCLIDQAKETIVKRELGRQS